MEKLVFRILRPSEQAVRAEAAETGLSAVFLPFRPRMGAVVHLRQAVEIEFGVNLGGGQVAVAEQLLYGSDVAGGLQQVAGVAVAHHVRAEVLRAAVFYRPVAQAVLDLADA